MFRILLFLIFIATAHAEEAKKQTICLNMIVKDEKDVIRRCLDSVKPVIDYWVIVDTGSKDGTQKIIKEHLKGIPGKLYERKWRNFGENRTEAFELAKGKADYILFMDADDVLEFEGKPELPRLTADQCNMWRGNESFSYLKPQLVKGNLPWKWVGVTHEYLACDQPFTAETLETVRYVSKEGGASHKDPYAKFMKNVRLLEDGLKKEPKNERYAFYLAESYRDAGEKAKALEWFQKRVLMGGWHEEIFCSKLQIGHMLRDLNLPTAVVIEAYKEAHRFRPHRCEPVYYLAEIYNQQGDHSKAYELIKAQAFVIKPETKDLLFNCDWIEEYGLLFQLSICSYFVGNYQESLDLCNKLLEIKNLPEAWRTQTIANRAFPLDKLSSVAEKKETACKKN